MGHARNAEESSRSFLKEAKAHGPPCVLVAEDDDDMRAILAAALRHDGYDVLEAGSGAELLEHVGTAVLYRQSYPAPDVIVSDVRMPGFTGLQVLAGLRSAHWSTPIVLMTAYTDAGTCAEARRLGARVFRKPFDLEDMRMAILEAVRSSAWARRAVHH